MIEDQRNQLATELFELEKVMREQGLWASEAPSDEALASQEPFAVDTLSFAEWLQFIFIVKMETLLQQGLPLPQACELTPIAEEAFKELVDTDTAKVLSIIKKIDELF